MLSTVAVVAIVAGPRSLAMLAVGLVAAALSLAAAFWFLSRRGAARWLSLTVFVVAPVAVIAVYALYSLLWVALVAAAGWLLAGMTARAALASGRGEWRMPEYPVSRPARHPFLIMNPKSGDGKVGRFDLQRKAEELGAEVFLLGGPEPVDVAAVARMAVARGADLLGVAGGDGTQALVAGVAAEHGIPFMVITAGTRNHFALDLGLDRENPPACLGALSDTVELRVDLGVIAGRTFVNNASFGAMVVSKASTLPSVRVLVFATNSVRRPSAIPASPDIEVIYLACAGKPLRTAPYRGLPRPGAVVGDQVATDGVLARRLGFTFLHYQPRLGDVPLGPRLMHGLGQLALPLLFSRSEEGSSSDLSGAG